MLPENIFSHCATLYREILFLVTKFHYEVRHRVTRLSNELCVMRPMPGISIATAILSQGDL
jgi:hypothetical protein